MHISKNQWWRIPMKTIELESALSTIILMMTPCILSKLVLRIVVFPKVYFWNATKSPDLKTPLLTTHGRTSISDRMSMFMAESSELLTAMTSQEDSSQMKE